MEQNLKLIEEEIKEALKKNKAYNSNNHVYAWVITSLAIMSYMGRFSSAKQAAWSLVRCHQHGGKIKEFYQRRTHVKKRC
ncbi:hypothetical protein LEP1GSC024_0340 [Leptospira noguchii str. 2001034031]|uniref:Uncharacterized protein n=1 Tax=Leptospira noguchii str. 2001034031 TaxID=1193053 RepID=M6YAD8_9LEPT|nr:hypothetical protein LEP1GSC024_0340 [Leptospira noguchii str. 2001034031]